MKSIRKNILKRINNDSNNNTLSSIHIINKNSSSFFTNDSYDNLKIKNNEIITQDDIEEGFEKFIPIPIKENQSFFNVSNKIDNKVNIKLSNLGIKEILDDLYTYINNENYNEGLIIFLENKLKAYKSIIENNEKIINIYNKKKSCSLLKIYDYNLKKNAFIILLNNKKKEKLKKRIINKRNIELKKDIFKIIKINHNLCIFKRNIQKKFLYKLKFLLYKRKKKILIKRIFINQLKNGYNNKIRILNYKIINQLKKIYLKYYFDKLYSQKYRFCFRDFFFKNVINKVQIIKINKKINHMLKKKSDRFKRQLFFKRQLDFIYKVKKLIINHIKFKIQRQISKKLILLNPSFKNIFKIIVHQYNIKKRRLKMYFYEFLYLCNYYKKAKQYYNILKKKELERTNLINKNKKILSIFIRLQNEMNNMLQKSECIDNEVEQLINECELLEEKNIILTEELNKEKGKYFEIFNNNIKEIEKLTKNFQNKKKDINAVNTDTKSKQNYNNLFDKVNDIIKRKYNYQK